MCKLAAGLEGKPFPKIMVQLWGNYARPSPPVPPFRMRPKRRGGPRCRRSPCGRSTKNPWRSETATPPSAALGSKAQGVPPAPPPPPLGAILIPSGCPRALKTTNRLTKRVWMVSSSQLEHVQSPAQVTNPNHKIANKREAECLGLDGQPTSDPFGSC